MTYATPPTEGKGISLLFTPASARARGDADKATPGGGAPEFASLASFGRSPGTGGHRLGGFGGAGSGRKEAPPSRRRSLTPASQPKDTPPPPPPCESLLDSPMGVPGLMAPPSWGALRADDGVEDMVVSTSPLVAPAPQQQAAALSAAQQQQQQQQQAALQQREVYEDTWITVYGFRSQSDLPLVLKEFSKCGDVLQFGSFVEGPACNWVHIQYANKYGAQRALLRSGEQLSAAVMIGVKPLDAAHRAAVERATAAAGPSSSLAMSFPRMPAAAAAAAQRPYAIGGTGAAAPVVPLPAKSLAQKLSEFVLGL